MELPPFKVTEAAIREMSDAGGCVRLDLEPGGCCGTAYSFAASLPRGVDLVFGCDGAQLAVVRKLSKFSTVPPLTTARV
jgi:Fe-S cluster assembly iron-binding protein IscA